MKSYYSPKSWSILIRQNRMTNKLSPSQAHLIVKDYIKIKKGTHSIFNTVKDLLVWRKIKWRNTPSKLKNKYDRLWKELYKWKEIEYKKNVFLERDKLRKHRKLPEWKYEKFVKKLPRGWYQTYEAECKQEWKKVELKKGRFYYYKKAMKMKTKSKAPEKDPSKYKLTAKKRYELLYEEYDLVIHVDGKSMEDQEWIWKNNKIKLEAKWLSIGVEAKSGIIVWIWVEKSHNKTNVWKIFKQICEVIEKTFWKEKKICFITDAGWEYLSNKDLRWLNIVDKEITKLTEYLRKKGHGWRITRRPEDNSFVENKNDYIERACLDNKEIMWVDMNGLMCLMEKFLEVNNKYLKGSKGAFRGLWKTGEENIKERFGEEKGKERIKQLHVQRIEKLHKIKYKYKNHNIISILYLFKKHVRPVQKTVKNCVSYDFWMMHPKSVDSSTLFFVCWSNVKTS